MMIKKDDMMSKSTSKAKTVTQTTPKNPKNVAKGRKGGRIGGRSKSRKKIAAVRRNIRLAQRGRLKARRIDEINAEMLANRVFRFSNGIDAHCKGQLDAEFDEMLKRKAQIIKEGR